MALAFPLPAPPVPAKWWTTRFALDRQQALSPTRGGTVAVDIGEPLWAADVVYQSLTRFEAGQVRGWLDALDGGVGSFLLYDRNRRYPSAYGPGGGVATGSMTAVNANLKDVTIGSLGANYQFRAGDYIEFAWGTGNSRRALHRVVADALGNASGVATVEVRPAIRGTFTFPRTVQLRSPSAVFRLVHGSVDVATDIRTGLTTASFSAVQVP